VPARLAISDFSFENLADFFGALPASSEGVEDFPRRRTSHMKYAFALVLSVICTMAIVTAQTPAAQAPSTQSEKPAAQPAGAGKVTYTGCLKPGTTADSWVLENAEMASAKSTATATSGAASKTSIGLTVKPSENLKPHANHKIEVVGTIGPAASTSGAAASSTAPRQNLTVESVKMVSATCP